LYIPDITRNSQRLLKIFHLAAHVLYQVSHIAESRSLCLTIIDFASQAQGLLKVITRLFRILLSKHIAQIEKTSAFQLLVSRLPNEHESLFVGHNCLPIISKTSVSITKIHQNGALKIFPICTSLTHNLQSRAIMFERQTMLA